MPRTTKKKPQPQSATEPPAPPELSASNGVDDVLTLAEAAAYLRVNEADLLGRVGARDIPGRQIGNEWRFLKSALQDWLRTPVRPSSKEAILSAIGSWKDDPYLDEMLREIYRQRGRPMTEDEE